MNKSKKLLMGLVYIYISIVALSAESIWNLGVSFPIVPAYHLSDSDFFYDGDAGKSNGVQASLKYRNVSDYNDAFTFAADFEIGRAKFESDVGFLDLNADIGLGAAVINTDNFVLIPVALVGINFKNHTERMSGIKLSEQLIQFEVGGEIYMAYWFSDFVGMFLSCKGMFQVGQWRIHGRDEYYGETEDVRLGKLKNFVVKPSVGVSFTF